jgi:GTP cyclohydrolase I
MKYNPGLGTRVHKYLLKKRVETPIIIRDESRLLSKIEANFREIMITLGLDLNDDSLCDTPIRVAKMFAYEIFSGLDYNNFPKATAVDNKMRYDEMVIVKDVNVQSTCEHHFVSIDGFATVAYIPRKKILGLSKINRIVKFFSKRPQIQERLTEQIFYALEYILETSDIAVIINATHHCVKSRGIEDTSSTTTTSKMGGVFKKNPTARAELLKLK